MSKESRLRADKLLRENHLRWKLQHGNKRLDETELAIMDHMRVGGPNNFEFTHALINERENIKTELKETHIKLYGAE